MSLPGKVADLTGMRFGRLLVEGYGGAKKATKGWTHYWICHCDCGTVKLIASNSLKQRLTMSCGCYNRDVHRNIMLGRENFNYSHGYTTNGQKPKIYRIWSQMIQRCRNPNDQRYEYYGARGITVCKRWQGSKGFVNFLKDMGPRPKNHQLDRADNDGNYQPENCHWVTRTEQARNSRNARMVTYQGRTQCVTAWAEELGFSGRLLQNRLRLGWTVERAFTQPARIRRRT